MAYHAYSPHPNALLAYIYPSSSPIWPTSQTFLRKNLRIFSSHVRIILASLSASFSSVDKFNFILNIFIPNLMSHGMPTHPSQDHLLYTFIFWTWKFLISQYSALWSHSVELTFTFRRHILPRNARCETLFYPLRYNMMCVTSSSISYHLKF